MKKVLIISVMIISIFMQYMTYQTYAESIVEDKSISKLIKLKESETELLKKYQERYGSGTNGTVAYILDRVRIYSYPACVLALISAAILEYVIGIRKMDVRDNGFFLKITIVTIFVICQILPFIFALVVKQ